MVRYARHLADLLDRAAWFPRTIQLAFIVLLVALALLFAMTIVALLVRTLAWLLQGVAA